MVVEQVTTDLVVTLVDLVVVNLEAEVAVAVQRIKDMMETLVVDKELAVVVLVVILWGVLVEPIVAVAVVV